jgi:4-carboxymuconolactone decarboxylase
MSRLERRAFAELSSEQQDVFEKIVAARPMKPKDGHIGGPFDAWVTSPEMGRRLLGLGDFFRFRTTVGRRYVELAILVTGQRWKAQFEWFAHEPMARDAGVPEEVILAIKAGAEPSMTDPKDQAAFALASELQDERTLSQATFDAAKAQFGEQGTVELIGLCGFYGLVSMTLNGLDVELPDGAELPFPT